MRILLAHNSLYFPSHGGGDKSNRLLMEALAEKGHAVRVVARMEHFGEEAHRQLARQLADRDVPFKETPELIRFERHSVDVRTLTRSTQLRTYFASQIAEFDPDIIVTSTDDPAQLLFDLARRAERARLVYLIRATIATPFGPDSSMRSAERTATLRHANGVVGVSEYVAEYARLWGGLPAVHVPISLMDRASTDVLGRFDNPFATLVNPCAVKGIDIFLALAERMPEVRFAAVPTWGTTPEEMRRLARHSNITLLPSTDNIDNVLRQTRVILVPSVWAEARSRMVMEAMLRGIPVIASDVGGLKEAKLGVPYLLPVNPVTHYQASLDRNMVPIADVPPQDVTPWQTALARLAQDEQHWQQISTESRSAALRYLETLTIDAFEAYLEDLIRKPKSQAELPGLSEDKKRLLALRLRQRAIAKWFPRCPEDERPRLFCFPHAGAGTLAYAGWNVKGYSICPALLPGREERSAEPPFESMPELIEALMQAIRPYLRVSFALFGHSMGAGVAFELARALRRTGQSLPQALFVSGARSPQYRLTRAMPPALTEQELESMGGGKALGADLQLYRTYAYTEQPPLPIPIFAYGGDADPNVSPDQLSEWQQQTTAGYKERIFPGGHFYFRDDLASVLGALTQDVNLA